MRIVFWGNGNRGVACLGVLCERGYRSELAVVHPPAGGSWHACLADVAGELGIRAIAPDDPNDASTAAALQKAQADVFVLAGYGKILRQHIIDIPRLMCINLHAGKVPEYRGSSPLNWALLNGENSFGLSVLKLDGGVDSGDVLMQREFEICANDTIRELHSIANEQFPVMLLEVLEQIESGRCMPKPQDPKRARYFPLRFPDDGLVLWDQLTAKQIHNRIRALTEPYPCAYTYFKGRKVKLISSEPASTIYNGESGRVYRKKDRGLLVCAADTCLWIKQACFADDDTPLADAVQRYERLATVGGLATAHLSAEARG
ncbi:MAG: methionyl-tRNA formyltransferase [Planctomycetes bacterium]|nr:methionyl-tRNA formyltransferase [Planctomycetota bacterium]